VSEAFPSSLSLKGRGTGAQRQGEGVTRRGKTPEDLLSHAKNLRTSQTEAEAKLWSRLRAGRFNGLKFRRQVPFSADYVADFVCPAAKLIIEVDGSQHVDQLAYDALRTRFFEGQGYRVIRFWNNQVLGDLDAVLRAVMAATSLPLPGASRLSLPPEGEGG
jgi:very-short-patch-repair endonuclease